MHFLQSKYWKESKKNLGNKVYDVGDYFFHTTPIPYIGKYVGYMPRPDLNNIDWENLYLKAKEAGCVYVTIDPDNLNHDKINFPTKFKFEPGAPVHLQENTEINLTKSEDELLNGMKQKHRYNLRLSEKKGVEVKISDSVESFKEFLKLYEDTVIRKGYHGRSKEYLETVWKTLEQPLSYSHQLERHVDQKSYVETKTPPFATIATAYYNGKPLASWMLFLFNDTVYYPYGGSSDDDKNVMATYKLVWEIIKWGKEKGFKSLDLWGIKRKNGSVTTEIEYDGFSRFKVGFGGEIVEYANTVDLVIDPLMYSLLNLGNKLRRKILFKE